MKNWAISNIPGRLSATTVAAVIFCASPALSSGHEGFGGIGGGGLGGATASVGVDVGGSIGGGGGGLGGGGLGGGGGIGGSADLDVDVGFGGGGGGDTGGGGAGDGSTGGGGTGDGGTGDGGGTNTGGGTGGGSGGGTGGNVDVGVDIGLGPNPSPGPGGTVTTPDATPVPNMRRVTRLLQPRSPAPRVAALPIPLDEMQGMPVVDRRGQVLGIINNANLANGSRVSLTIAVSGVLGVNRELARVTVSKIRARRGAIWLPMSRDSFVGSLG